MAWFDVGNQVGLRENQQKGYNCLLEAVIHRGMRYVLLWHHFNDNDDDINMQRRQKKLIKS